MKDENKDAPMTQGQFQLLHDLVRRQMNKMDNFENSLNEVKRDVRDIKRDVNTIAENTGVDLKRKTA